MTRISLLCLLTTMTLGAAGTTAVDSAAAGADFDGAWNVRIMTDRGVCESIHNLNVDIRDGALAYADPATLQLHGHVSSDGAVQVHVIAGGQSANGTGHLTTHSGSGTWRGASANGTCTGHWSAERI